MKTFLGLCAILACSCGGTDNTAIDGGSDATTGDAPTSDGNPNDVTTTDAGSDTGTGNDSGSGDSGTNDSGTTGDGGSKLFPCYMMTCDSTTTYCNLQEIGPQPADGGFAGNATCITYPTTCGSTPSCACIPKTFMCTCTQNGPDITNTCGGV